MSAPPAPSPPPALPPGHFLALPPTFATHSSTTTASHASHLAPNVASLAAADFDVDVRTGFLPATPNIARLTGPYVVWEEALDAASGEGIGHGLRLGGGDKEEQWRAAVRAMQTVPVDGLITLPILRRAHSVLAFLLHFYIHSAADQPSSSSSSTHAAPVVPACIAVPLTAVSASLGLPPILTYADTVLYNYVPAAPGITSLTNLPARTLATFTHTQSEANFFLLSAECEIAGAAALRLMRQSLDELFLSDEVALRRLTTYLTQLTTMIDRVGDVTLKTLDMVDPEEFYHLIRPWFRGGDGEGPDMPGWIFEGVLRDGVNAAENTLGAAGAGSKFSGPSAGQSSLVHAIDIFLSVDHAERPDEAEFDTPPTRIHVSSEPISASAPDAADSDAAAAAPAHPTVEATFLHRMLQYMPAQHRAFLTHLSTLPTPLRPLVVAHQHTHPALAAAYDGALAALKRFRDKHMRVVSFFVIQQARRQPSARVRRMLGQLDAVDADADADAEHAVDTDKLRGTGGTPLVRFLKRCRDNTTRAMVGSAPAEA
ncbi:hypothetical protein Q5752_004787 [Cryptotrichosporon argae]